jgi:ETC complex I subunit conserved region
MSKNVTALSKCITQEALEAVTAKLNGNIWAVPSRTSPNAAKLIDGAIQRMSVVPDRGDLHVKANVDRVGFYKRDENNIRSSRSAYIYSNPWDDQIYRSKIARIYHPQRKHVHNHPQNKQIGKHWVIEFESWGTYKSPLMFFTSGTRDTYSKHTMKVQTLSAAIKTCEMMGWGYDILYPQQRWHTKKSYSDNFSWKGKAPEEELYD